MLRELADEGRVETKRKKLHQPGALPSVTLADITGRDSDGELIATPTEWDEDAHGAAPKIRITFAAQAAARRSRRRRRPRAAARRGNRRRRRSATAAASSRSSTRPRCACSASSARCRTAADGWCRSTRSSSARSSRSRASATKDAQDGDLVAVSVQQHSRLRPADRARRGTARLAQERARGQPDRHPRPRHPARVPGRGRGRSRRRARPADAASPAARTGASSPLVTIDPADAKDHDDAVHAAPDPDPDNPGGHILTVAIADVAHYVRPGSALDREALKRGNSVYFPDRVVPMLPERISNDLCSLRANEDRAALAVRMIIGRDGRKRSHTFHRVLMRSAAKLNYQQAQAAIDGRTDETTEPLLDPVLKPLYAAYEALKNARDARGPLDLDLPERKILLKADGTVDRVITPERLESHRLIEEFMILANVAAAETLEGARVPLIYRVHDEPSLEKVEALRQFLATLHISLPKGGAMRAEQFNRILAQVKGQDVEKLVNEVVLRTQVAGRIFRGELRPFRTEPAPLRAFHLADPPLRRPDRASRADPRAQLRRRRPAREPGHRGADRDRRADFGLRAPRHEGRARDQRPADRASPCRPHRRDASRAASPASPAPACSSSSTTPAPTASSRRAPSATNISATKRPCTPWSATARARRTGSATASR